MLLQLAGPMTGLPEYNFPAFAAAAAQLRSRGHDVWSPAEGSDTNGEHAYYMRRSLTALMDADALVLLPGWQQSPGSRTEVAVALAFNIPIVPLEVANAWR